MNDQPPPAPAPAKLKGFVQTYAKQFAAALVVAVATALVAAFQPLMAFIGGKVTPEHLEIGQTLVITEHRDSPVQITLRAAPDANLSGGILTVHSSDPSLAVLGQQTFDFPAGTGSVTVPAAPGLLRLRSSTVGEAELNVKVHTNKGATFNGVVKVQSLAAEASVTENDLSGVWRVRLDDSFGSMTLRQRSRTDLHLSGDITLDDGRKLLIQSGFRDGIVFQITAMSAQAAPALRYQIEGVWCLIDRNGSRWMVVNAKSQGYRGDTPVRGARPAGLEEKCPDAESMLAEAPGSGTFHASAPLG